MDGAQLLMRRTSPSEEGLARLIARDNFRLTPLEGCSSVPMHTYIHAAVICTKMWKFFATALLLALLIGAGADDNPCAGVRNLSTRCAVPGENGEVGEVGSHMFTRVLIMLPLVMLAVVCFCRGAGSCLPHLCSVFETSSAYRTTIVQKIAMTNFTNASAFNHRAA